MGSRLKTFTPQAQERFLEILEQTGRITDSCMAANVTLRMYKDLLKASSDFVDACEEANQRYNDAVEAEIHRRAVVGYEEPVFYRGDKTDTIRKYSDSLLLALARRRIVGYRDSLKVEGKVDHSVVPDTGIGEMSKEARDGIREILAREAARVPSAEPPSRN